MAYRINSNEFIGVADGKAHFFEITGRGATDQNSSRTKEDFSRWKDNAIDMGNFKVIPFGNNNNIPNEIQETIFPNHLAPRIQERKSELLFGQGPYLYRHNNDGTEYTRVPVEDEEISDWLNSIDHENLLIHNSTEYYYGEQIYTKIRRAKGGRLGRNNAIASLEPLSSANCRKAYLRDSKTKTPTHIIVGPWGTSTNQEDFEVYPLWDRNDPTRYPVAIHYCGFRSFGLSDYVLPAIYGSLGWIQQSTTAPKVIKAFTTNSLNVRFHITSPQKYWDDMRENLKKQCQERGEPYKEKMMQDLEDKIFDTLSEVLCDVENVGKFWHNKTVTSVIGGQAVEQGWKITPIKQEVKEYVEAQLKVADKADFATVAALGLHASLANVGADGKSDSGSEQLYARVNHEQTSLPIPEHYVTKALNEVIKIKFGRDIRVGFYHVASQRQQDITSSQRVTNINT